MDDAFGIEQSASASASAVSLPVPVVTPFGRYLSKEAPCVHARNGMRTQAGHGIKIKLLHRRIHGIVIGPCTCYASPSSSRGLCILPAAIPVALARNLEATSLIALVIRMCLSLTTSIIYIALSVCNPPGHDLFLRSRARAHGQASETQGPNTEFRHWLGASISNF